MQEGDKICIVRETGTDPVTSDNTEMVAALVTLGVPFYEAQPFLETREIVDGQEKRTVTWCLATKTADGRFKTRELIQWWWDAAWLQANASNPKALLALFVITPRFIDPLRSLPLQYCFIAASMVAIDLAVMSGYTAIGSRIMRSLTNNLWRRRVDGFFGCLFLIAAVLVAKSH